MPFEIIREDITKLETDAIVCNGNCGMRNRGGVSGQIIAAAGSEMEAKCIELGGCAPGEAVVTLGYRLPVKTVIHTVGPKWCGGENGEEHILRLCYRNVLKAAAENGCKSLGTPLIASGRYRVPKDIALRIASEEILGFLSEHEDMDVKLVVFGAEAYQTSLQLFSSVQSYIEDNYTVLEDTTHSSAYGQRLRNVPEWAKKIPQPQYNIEFEPLACESAAPALMAQQTENTNLDDVVSKIGVSFKHMLLQFIDKSQRINADVYNAANMTRQAFNNIINRENYNPSKSTVLALAVSLRLNLDQTLDLLATAGYTLSHSSKFDVIVEYFIKNGRYDILEINCALYDYNERQLGAST